MRVLSVSQINFFIKSLIEGDGRMRDIYARGEISNFTDHYRSGHLYFSLKDEKSVLKAVMFSSAAHRLRFHPKEGMRVIVRGRVAVYEPGGQYQFYVEEMQPDGVGALSLAFEQLKEKLAAEGLFAEEHKRPIPPFPARIGVITSPTGAAVQDIRNILSRRWPAAEIMFCPVLVQGEDAAAQLTAAVKLMNAQKAADVIIIGRGGGSAEDLAAFNDETLARAVFASKIPVISAVGHETDFTIADFVADVRAPTPSAAAELAVTLVVFAISRIRFIRRKHILMDYVQSATDAVGISVHAGTPFLYADFAFFEAVDRVDAPDDAQNDNDQSNNHFIFPFFVQLLGSVFCRSRSRTLFIFCSSAV